MKNGAALSVLLIISLLITAYTANQRLGASECIDLAKTFYTDPEAQNLR